MKSLHTALIVFIALLTSSWCCRPEQNHKNDQALKEFQDQVDGALPTIASLTGIQNRKPVKVDLFTRADLGRFLEQTLKLEYPNEELNKLGKCLALIGLLPEGYDLEQGFMTLLKQQAGAIYDPRSKTLIGLSDLPPEQKRAVNDKMILSHELTHALQDRVINITEESEKALKNIDYGFAVRAILEGMASSVMIAYAQNLPHDKLPDLQKFWRSQLAQLPGGTLGGFPPYVSEYLMSPYAEGGAFIQAWQKENPNNTLNNLLKRVPESSEQALHYEKYTGKDKPTDIDLSRVHKTLPGEWTLFYCNTLGEFELLQLFQNHEESRTNAATLAAGWDGCRFEAYEDENGALILFGSSAWDSEKDAQEFCEGLTRVWAHSRADGDHEADQNHTRVNFVIGHDDTTLRRSILRQLSEEG